MKTDINNDPNIKPIKNKITGAQRQLKILEAALPLFATQGFSGTTTRSIAQAAEVSEALLYKYFPSKKAIYIGIGNLCCSNTDKVVTGLSDLNYSTKTLVQLMYLMHYVIFIGNPRDKYNAEIVRRLVSYSMLEDGVFARTFIQMKMEKWMPIFSQCLKVAQDKGEAIANDDQPELNIWMSHHLAVGLGMLNHKSIITYGVSKEKVLHTSILFCLRGMGLTEESIKKHFDHIELNNFIQRLLCA